ncbi:MAG: hypothetical protein MUC28_02405 [Planctomycetes bacterium]|jgi:tRNA A37 threonylcarbamoyladenosine modification protein TsaB|nr:hypothetical protein [Planctomycetota bacterium]
MILFIDTTQADSLMIALAHDQPAGEKKEFLVKLDLSAKYDQAEKLLPGIEKLCRQAKIKISDLGKIAVNNRHGGFSALRIGVVTANALGYALGTAVAGLEKQERSAAEGDFDIVRPAYRKEPNITVKK